VWPERKLEGGDEKIAHKILMMNAAGELYTNAFTHRSFYTQKLLHTQALLHREVFTQSGSYTQKLLHTEAFAQRSL